MSVTEGPSGLGLAACWIPDQSGPTRATEASGSSFLQSPPSPMQESKLMRGSDAGEEVVPRRGWRGYSVQAVGRRSREAVLSWGSARARP